MLGHYPESCIAFGATLFDPMRFGSDAPQSGVTSLEPRA